MMKTKKIKLSIAVLSVLMRLYAYIGIGDSFCQ